MLSCPLMSENMKDKIALVTGSSRGVGKDIALKLAGVSAGVIVHYLNSQDQAVEVVQEIRRMGKLSEAIPADLTVENEAAGLIREAQKLYGKLDILVNNFGPIQVKNWQELASSDWEQIIHGNLLSAWYCMKGVLPGMRRREWGRIINLGYSRVEQLTAFPSIAPYAIAKTGLLILTRTAAFTEASKGITVNMVSPGLLEEGILPRNRNIPAERLGRFEDVSHAVLFLASSEADFITGTNLVVAGGWKL